MQQQPNVGQEFVFWVFFEAVALPGLGDVQTHPECPGAAQTRWEKPPCEHSLSLSIVLSLPAISTWSARGEKKKYALRPYLLWSFSSTSAMKRSVFTCLNAARDVVPAIEKITVGVNFSGEHPRGLQNAEYAGSVSAVKCRVSGTGKQSPACENGSVRSRERKTRPRL